ncbi:hypothetical protein D031_3647A, partial [Vibrio parahaemolyticus VP-48]
MRKEAESKGGFTLKGLG